MFTSDNYINTPSLFKTREIQVECFQFFRCHDNRYYR